MKIDGVLSPIARNRVDLAVLLISSSEGGCFRKVCVQLARKQF